MGIKDKPMTRTWNDMLHDFLFDNEESKLLNLKLLRGDSPDVTKENICEQLHAAFVQRAANQAHTVTIFPEPEGSGGINLVSLENRL